MSLTKEEKEFIIHVLKQKLKNIKKEEKTILEHPSVKLLAAEGKYEDFVKNIIKKLK